MIKRSDEWGEAMEMLLKKFLKSQKGFTLLELLVIVVILSILAAIAIANYQEAVAIANGKAILANLRVINDAIERYHFDTNRYPKDAGPKGLEELVSAGYIAAIPKGIKKGEPIKFSPKGKIFKATGDFSYLLADIAENRGDPNELHAKEATLNGLNFQEWIEIQEKLEN